MMDWLRMFLGGAYVAFTNHIVAHIPAYALRHGKSCR